MHMGIEHLLNISIFQRNSYLEDSQELKNRSMAYMLQHFIYLRQKGLFSANYLFQILMEIKN